MVNTYHMNASGERDLNIKGTDMAIENIGYLSSRSISLYL